MYDLPFDQPTPEDRPEADYWESERRRHDYAEWIEQQAVALADEMEADEEPED